MNRSKIFTFFFLIFLSLLFQQLFDLSDNLRPLVFSNGNNKATTPHACGSVYLSLLYKIARETVTAKFFSLFCQLKKNQHVAWQLCFATERTEFPEISAPPTAGKRSVEVWQLSLFPTHWLLKMKWVVACTPVTRCKHGQVRKMITVLFQHFKTFSVNILWLKRLINEKKACARAILEIYS